MPSAKGEPLAVVGAERLAEGEAGSCPVVGGGARVDVETQPGIA